MGITVYAYAVDPVTSTINGYGSSIESVVRELQEVRAEIALEDGYEAPTSEVYAFDLYKPDLDQLLSVMSGDAELCDLILKNKRLVTEVSTNSA